jgi:nicotinate phosphoribosyltransferase
LTLVSQNIDTNRDLTFFNELYPNHKTTFKANEYSVKELLVPLFKNGKQVYESPDINAIKKHCEEEISTLYPGVKRLKNPHKYYVDLSDRLLDLKKSLIDTHH